VAVTGANSGLGFSTAKKLAELGAKVYMLCRDMERGEAAKAKIDRGEVILVRVDMADYESIMSVEKELPDELDVLIHNAGAMFDKRSHA
jgi:NADP-dependent 3-hydroxy acid dehydrogenase YdfG